VAAALRLSVALPGDWLASAGPDAERSPLRHLRAATLTGRADGSAEGAVHCLEPGCAELARFLERAARDLLTGLPSGLALPAARALRAEVIPAAPGSLGRVALSYAPSGVPLSRLVEAALGPRLPGRPSSAP
jgi:hypothetical protein